MPHTAQKGPAIQLNSVQATSFPIPGEESWHLAENDPAILSMTDFRSRHSVVVSETSTIDDALDHMKHTGVRCAFVVDEKKNVVIGMITSYDIQGEKPQQHMHFAGVAHKDVLVKDIMQKISDWRVADIADIEKSTVGDVLEIFKQTGVTHLPVTETLESNEIRLRGLLSFAKVKRLLVL